MTKEEIIKFLKENLRVEMQERQGMYGGTKVTVTLFLGDEEISSDIVCV